MGETGIYEIRNAVNGKRYIGSAVRLPNRKRQHFQSLARGDHHAVALQRAWRVYGSDAFEFRVLLLCAKENLIMYEQALLDGLRPEYNSAPRAGSQLGFKMPDAAKAKMSAAAKRTRNFTGHKHSDESRAKISVSRKGKGGGPMDQNRRAKIGAAHRGRIITPEQRAKISAALTGHKQGEEQIAKRRASMPAGHYERVARAKAKLSDEQVILAIRRVMRGESTSSVARDYGVARRVVSRIVRGSAYPWVAR